MSRDYFDNLLQASYTLYSHSLFPGEVFRFLLSYQARAGDRRGRGGGGG